MAGPNDVGVLRGIIGDGKSMNDEEMKEKVRGKPKEQFEPKSFLHMPSEKQHLTNNRPQVQGFSSVKALQHFMGGSRPAQNNNFDISRFTGRTNGLRMDRFSRNSEEVDKAVAEVASNPSKVIADIGDKHRGKDTIEISQAKGGFTVSDKNKQKILELNEQVLEAQQQAQIAKYEKEGAESRKAQKDLYPVEKGKKRVVLPKVTLTAPEWYDKDTGKKISVVGALAKGTGSYLKEKLWDNPMGARGAPTAKTSMGTFQIEESEKKYLPNIGVRKGAVYKSNVELEVPTKSGLRDFAAGIADNLGPNIAGGNVLIGPFEPQGGTQKIRTAGLAYQAYKQTLEKRHKASGNPGLLQAKMTLAERQRLEKLKQGVAAAQQTVGAGGFMGGPGGQAVLMGSRPQGALNQFTNLGGAFERQAYGSYRPEAMGLMGVGQGLRADQPNKWNVLLGQSGGGSDKITQILGKNPDPTGQSESAAAKIKRLAGI